MRAVQLVALGQPYQVRELPLPEVGPEDVLVRVARTNFNGGDPQLVTGTYPVPAGFDLDSHLPLTVGHDGAGVIAAIGGEVNGYNVGDRVFINPGLHCGECDYCRRERGDLCRHKVTSGWPSVNPRPLAKFRRYRHGLAAEYILAHPSQLHRLPNEVSFRAAGHLNMLGHAYRALSLGRPSHGDTLVITGATGCVGASAVLLARLFHPKRIIAVARDAGKLERLRAVDPSVIEVVSATHEDISDRLLDLTGGEGAGILLDFMPRGGGTTARQAIHQVRPGGRVVLTGGSDREELCLAYRFLIHNSIEMCGFTGVLHQHLPPVMELLRSGKLDLTPIAVREFALEEANQAIQVFMERPGDQPFWVQLLPNADLA